MFQSRLCLFFTLTFIFSTAWAQQTFFDLSAQSIEGKKIHFSQYRGKVVLVVNTASQCGFTPQLKELEDLQKKYSGKGFTVLAFPSNDFKQDPSENSAIQSFAKSEYNTSFQFFEKGSVSGTSKQPVYKFLTDSKTGFLFKDVHWNFEKFLVGRNGQVIERWSSMTKPSSKNIVSAIEKALAEPL